MGARTLSKNSDSRRSRSKGVTLFAEFEHTEAAEDEGADRSSADARSRIRPARSDIARNVSTNSSAGCRSKTAVRAHTMSASRWIGLTVSLLVDFPMAPAEYQSGRKQAHGLA